MVLTKEESIVADSTVSSSPSHTTTTVKRPTRTYGRPRDLSTVDAEHRRSSSSSSSANTSSIYWTGPVNTQEEIPPSSDPPHSSPGDRQRYVDEGESGKSSVDASSKFEFSWRRNLREMDRDDDIDDAENQESRERTSSSMSKPASAPKPLSIEQREGYEAGSSQRAVTPPVSLLDDIFHGSLTTLTSSSQGPSNPEDNSSPVKNRRRALRRVDEESESGGEQEDPEVSSPTKPFPITSPARASSPTPPTSEDEMPTAKQPQRGNRGASARRSGPPLTFEDEQIAAVKSGGGAKAQNKGKRRVKGLTRKEKQEMQKESHRIKAEREVHIAPTEPSKKLTLASWTKSVMDDTSEILSQAPSKPPKGDLKSSPILEFSSPLPDKRLQNRHPGPLNPKRNTPSFVLHPTERAASDDEDELPELGGVTADVQATFKPESHGKRRDLHAKKLALLARRDQNRTTAGEIDDEGDLQIVGSVTPAIGHHVTKRILARRGAPSATTPSAHLNRGRSQLSAKGSKKTMLPSDINKDLVHLVKVAGKSARDKKEEEWLRNGGLLPEMKQNDGIPVESMRELLRKSFDKRRQAEDEEEEEDDDSDESWNPDLENQNRGSPSLEAETCEDVDGDPIDITIINTVDNEELSQDALLRCPRNKRAIHTIHSDSEGENDGNVSRALPTLSAADEDEDIKILSARRGSISSLEGGTEDECDKENEYDKENDTRRMYDRSEDKENTAVVRYSTTASRPLLGSRQGSLFGLEEGLSSRLSMSPGRTGSDEENNGNDRKGPQRKPLQPLEPRKSLLASPDLFFNRLRQVEPDSGPASSGDEPPSTLEPALNLVRPRANAGFSQFSDEEFENAVPKPLQGGLPDLFESTTQNSPSSSRSRHLGTLKRPPSLGLTQDVEGRPVLAVDDQLQRKADEIFEKEQGWVIERADEQYHKRPELYVNDAGFLTQTRPEGTPDIYRPLPTQVESISRQPSQILISQRRTLSEISLSSSSNIQRTPFRDISLTAPDIDGTLVDSPSNGSRRRLMKKRDSSSPSGDAPVASTTLSNPFKLHKSKVSKNRVPLPQKSEFVAAEAQESDEDELFGFARRKAGDDDEDDENEDQDKTLDTLVDDKEMDEDTVNREAVLEKFQEHAEADDQQLEKMNQEVIQGEWRKKRRRGIGVEDSDEEYDDDYKQRKIRRKMHGDVQIDRQNIKELGNHPETSAFFDSYKKGIQDDDDNKYLAEVFPDHDVTMGDATVVEEEREEDVVTAAQIQTELRQAAQNNADGEEPGFDPRDVSWADKDDDEVNVPVKIVPGRRAADLRGSHRQPDDHEIYVQRSSCFMENDQQRADMRSWAKMEDRMRSRAGNGRSVASATITGHKKPKLASGGGSLRGRPGSSSKDAGVATIARTSKSVKPAPSFLKDPALERSSRFGQ